MKESAFWTTIRANLPQIFWTRIESSASVGIFDVNGLFTGGKEIWVELKIMKGNRIEFQKTQIAWAQRRLNLGSTNMVVIARKDSTVIVFDAQVVKIVPSKIYPNTVSIDPKGQHVIEKFTVPVRWSDLYEILKAKATLCRSQSEQ